jgi:hypothetical protein
VYSQLGKYVGPNFFPAGNQYAEQLSFWAAYAVAFVVRPLGAILFGELLLLDILHPLLNLGGHIGNGPGQQSY